MGSCSPRSSSPLSRPRPPARPLPPPLPLPRRRRRPPPSPSKRARRCTSSTRSARTAGAVLDTNKGKAPLTYTHGEEQIMPALEKSLVGMHAGEEKHVVLKPDEAFGPVDPNALTEVPKDMLPADSRNVGTRLMARNSDGQMRPVTVKEVKDDTIILDLNHPLAGKTIVFDVKVLNVEPPKAAGRAQARQLIRWPPLRRVSSSPAPRRGSAPAFASSPGSESDARLQALFARRAGSGDRAGAGTVAGCWLMRPASGGVDPSPLPSPPGGGEGEIGPTGGGEARGGRSGGGAPRRVRPRSAACASAPTRRRGRTPG